MTNPRAILSSPSPPSPAILPTVPAALGTILGALLLPCSDAVLGQDASVLSSDMLQPLDVTLSAGAERAAAPELPGFDRRVEARLVMAYISDEQLSPFDIGVDVEGHTITLSGTVDSPAQRDLAARLVRDYLGGGTQIENRLQVAPPDAPAPRSNPFYRILEHADAATRVKLQLLWHRSIDGLRIGVTTHGDTLVLFGDVRSEAARQLAERIAQRTRGVGSVEDLLRVRTDGRGAEQDGSALTADPVSDAWIKTRVTASLRLDRAVDAGGIDVSSADGVLTLSGTVPTAAQKHEADVVAGAIDGVQRVENQLVVH